jgi:hypothetical protein
MPAVVSKFIQHVVPGVLKPLRVLWNQMIGFTYIVFAVVCGWRLYIELRTEAKAFPILLLGLATAMMLYFGLYSFFRARRISRS